jgi:ABC-2 type transport system permease protein
MNALRFEWIKFRSLRGSWLMVGATVLAGLALSVLGVSDLLGASPSDLPVGWDPTATSLKGFLFAQLLIGMVGALAITPEFVSGVVGSSLAVVPSRTRLLAAKTAVVGCVVAVTALVTTLSSFGLVQVILGVSGLPAASLADRGVLGALVGGTIYLTAIGLGGLAVGVVTRSATWSLAVLVGALLLVPALAPAVVGDTLAAYWPVTAAQSAFATVRVPGAAPAAAGMILLLGLAGAVGLVGYATFRRRDVQEA